jgi:hypothetical protein
MVVRWVFLLETATPIASKEDDTGPARLFLQRANRVASS